MSFRIPLLSVLAIAALGATSALAQTEQEFVEVLTGDWAVHDDVYAVDGATCRVTLKSSKAAEDYELTTESCNLELGMLTGWRILDQQLALVAGDAIIATLGGNQFRMSGSSNIGAPVILDRAGEQAPPDPIRRAHEISGCYYLGFTSTCADEAQLSKPAIPADGAAARIGVLVNLNVRTEARDDAEIVGVVPANSCIVTETCATASDGVWCKARFGEAAGWLKKVALRQERWPVLTFVNQCESD